MHVNSLFCIPFNTLFLTNIQIYKKIEKKLFFADLCD